MWLILDFQFRWLILYHVDLEKRGKYGVGAREGHESRISQYDELLAEAKQLKIFPLFKIFMVQNKWIP